jgi:hypothetical protein
MIEHLGDCVLERSSPLVTEADSVDGMIVLDCLDKAARSGQTVRVAP